MKAKRFERLLPPKNIIGNPSHFRKSGKRFLEQFILLGGLRPGHAVLDAGCGWGRIAITLIPFLKKGGRYEGFDVDPRAIGWCARRIHRNFSRFRFQRADVFNGRYNPGGKLPASKYAFPWEDGIFDFVVSISLFTHMLPPDVERYLSEIARVLKRGGRCYMTCWMLNPDSRKLLASGPQRVCFAKDFGTWATANEDEPEGFVALEEEHLRDQYEKFGLKILEPIFPGSWCGREDTLSDQDILIATKR